MSDAPLTITEREQLAAAKEATQERRAALQAEVEKIDRWLEWFDEGIQIADSNGSAPALPPASPPPAEKPRPAHKRKAAPSNRHTGTRHKQADDSEKVQRGEKVLAFIREHPRCSRADICEALGLTPYEFKVVMKQLNRKKQITRTGSRAGSRYTIAGTPILPTSGPKTEVERAVYEALSERPLTCAAVSVKVGRNQVECGSVLEAMARRGLLNRLDTDDPPVRYEQAEST